MQHPWSLTLLLLLLFLLLQFAFLDTAQLGLANAPSLADGLQQSGPATGGVNYLLRSSLNRGFKEKGEGLLNITGWEKAAQPQAGGYLRILANKREAQLLKPQLLRLLKTVLDFCRQ